MHLEWENPYEFEAETERHAGCIDCEYLFGELEFAFVVGNWAKASALCLDIQAHLYPEQFDDADDSEE